MLFKELRPKAWIFNLVHPRRVLLLHSHLRPVAPFLILLVVLAGLLSAVILSVKTGNCMPAALVFLATLSMVSVFIFYLSFAERFFSACAVQGGVLRRSVGLIYHDYLNLPDSPFKDEIDRYCAMIAYMDLRFSDQVLYLSCFDRLMRLEEFRQELIGLRLDEQQQLELVRELSRFVLASRLYEDWVIVGMSPNNASFASVHPASS